MWRVMVLLVLVMVFGGCGTLLSSNTEREATAALKGTATHDVKKAPGIHVPGDHNTLNIGNDALEKLRTTQQAALGLRSDSWAWMKSRNPATLILYGVGVIVLVFAFGKLLAFMKRSAAVRSGLTLLDNRAQRLMQRKAGTNDADEDARLAQEMVELQREREAVTNGHNRAA